MKYLIHGAALAAALALAGCGGSDKTEANMSATDNMSMDANAMSMDANAMNGMDANMTMDANAMGANGMAADSNTANAMAKDLNTNDPDTNLANGM